MFLLKIDNLQTHCEFVDHLQIHFEFVNQLISPNVCSYNVLIKEANERLETDRIPASRLHDLTEADADPLSLITLVGAEPLLQNGNYLWENLFSQFPHQVTQCPCSNLKCKKKSNDNDNNNQTL